MNRFLEKFYLFQFKTEPGRYRNMNKAIRNTEVETVIKYLPQDKSPRPDGFTGEFHKTLRQELTPILPKSS